MNETVEKEGAAVAILTRLNQQYIDAFMQGDVPWYRANLADDFVCIESDGSVLGKEAFLRNASRGPDVATYRLEDVRIRMFGHIALVHATGRFYAPRWIERNEPLHRRVRTPERRLEGGLRSGHENRGRMRAPS
jgi:Domain of unknown function (DUF4440)